MKKRSLYPLIFFLITAISFSPFAIGQINPVLDTTATEGIEAEKLPDDYSDEETVETVYQDTLTSKFRPLPADTIERISNDKGFYYKTYFDSLLRARQKIQKDEPQKKMAPQGDSFFESFFDLIIWTLAIGVLAFLVYKLFISNSSLFSRSRRNKAGEVSHAEEGDLNDLDAMIRKAMAAGNYRTAVRYLYLQTLSSLSEKKFIEMGTEKTNYQYVKEVRNQSFANEFASITLKYEYIWYGEYPVDNLLFEQIHLAFKNFNKSIGK